MKLRSLLCALVPLAASLLLSACQTGPRTFRSPNGAVELTAARTAGGGLSLELFHCDAEGRHLVLTLPALGCRTADGGGEGLRWRTVSDEGEHEVAYTLTAGKRRECTNRYRECLFRLTDTLRREQLLRVRLYDDGLAFRYELAGLDSVLLGEEQTTYRIAEGTPRWVQPYTEPYEAFFPLSRTGEGVRGNRHWGYPALFQPAAGSFALITEAGIERLHSASTLRNEGDPADYRVTPARNAQPLSGTWCSPWRTVIVGSLAEVVESTLVTDVSPECRLADTSWIRPGSAAWVYWAYNRGSKDFQIVKRYIDLAAELHFPYVLIDWEWDIMGNGGTIGDALRYAAERGVRTLLWYNSSTAWTTNGAGGPLFKLNRPEDREREFAWLESLGVAGVKIDFFSGDLEETMAYCLDLLESAARHHLLVNFHGATIPRGWQRTWPNLLTVEAVYGAEWYNNLPVLTNRAAAHNATLPFTRNVIGPMDYTPCAFSDSQHPHITTHAHELALPVLYESALQHWADKPESYLAQPQAVRDLMSELPTVWDETRLVTGYPGEEAVLARRSGNRWYVGGIHGFDKAHTLRTDWSFLPDGTYRLRSFADSGDATNPWKIDTQHLTRSDLPAEISCLPRGGFVFVLEAE